MTVSDPEELSHSSEDRRVCAVVLTLNEAADIERCLTALRWCDDVVVVDSGSTDATVSTAEGSGARTFVHRPDGRYRNSDQRDWALDNCGIETEWVLFIDADEEVTPRLAEEVRRVCSSDHGYDAYQLTPKYLFWGRWMKRCLAYPNWHDRLLRRGRVRVVGGVWEHFVGQTKVGRIQEPYLHYGNSKGVSEWLRRHDGYSTWDAEQAIAYLRGEGAQVFGTERKLVSRRLASRLWPARPVLRFLVMYLLRGGFLDGPPAFVFCLRYAFFDYLTAVKIVELRRRERDLPL